MCLAQLLVGNHVKCREVSLHLEYAGMQVQFLATVFSIQGGSRGWFRHLAPATDVGEFELVLSSWLLPGPILTMWAFKSEQVKVRYSLSLSLSLSVYYTFQVNTINK